MRELRRRLERVLLHHPDEAVVVATSGSSGTPKQVRLTGAALRASGEATARALGGHGRWLLALPTDHVAGLQVLARSVLAGTEPVPLPAGMPFTPASFAAAARELAGSGGRRYVSLVPTQLHRLLEDPDGTRAAATFDAVLVGAAATDPALLDRAREAGVRVVTTYGMSETCGGCVYDGRPLDEVRVRLDDGRIWLAGPVLAEGYVDDQALTDAHFVQHDGRRWFVTDDRGRLDPATGLLRVLGRVDDVIVTGGRKVEPRDVEAALLALPTVGQAAVVALPDPEWGQVVAALVAPAHPVDRSPTPEELREAVRTALPPHAVPRRIVVGDGLPLLPTGKPDRAQVRAVLSGVRSGAEHAPSSGRMGPHPSEPERGHP